MRLFDLHCDTLTERLAGNQNLSVTFDDAPPFRDWKQVFAIWLPDDEKEPAVLAQKLLDEYDRLKQENLPCTPLLAIENGRVLRGKLDDLAFWKEQGVVYITLTWNGENEIAGGQLSDAGLSSFGKDLLQQMKMLKVIPDMSHLNDRSFYDVLEATDGPLMASHSNLRSVCPHPRNLTEEQFCLLMERDAIVGLNFCDLFLRDGGNARLEDIWRHLYRFLELGGIHNICIGADFDGAPLPHGLSGTRDMPRLWEFLLNQGLSLRNCESIFYENAQEFFEKTFQEGENQVK